jgi:rubrerythrin
MDKLQFVYTSDMKPVVHGYWKPYHAGPQTYPFWNSVCSVCGYKVAMVMEDWNYCPHCAAKMDGDA